MADFPPDLEDGELWLPSDIIRDVGVRRPFSSSSSSSSSAVAASPGCSAHLAYLEGIARQLDALCMLDRAGLLPAFGPPRHAPPRPRVSLRFPFPSLPFPSPLFGSSSLTVYVFWRQVFGFKQGRPAPRLAGAENLVGVGVVHAGFMTGDGGRGVPGSSPGMLRFCSMSRPVQTQATFGAARGGVVQAPVQPVPDRFIPLPSPGSAREGGGTGVFLPRVFKDEDKKKPYVKGRGEQQQQQATRNGGVWEQGMPFQHPPPPAETGLPQDWTY
ncbi:unnamed protein product [Musa acuminata subsp. malaccensis]|uniref:(wild Malaysian banana) hypothetical protein n=1 Tax=Musa acuminata subsp. malaccensis TaxID=214687 RepID=A0A804KUP9_MUSAM|nr:unnamed protein product [Musa acuminata subsp. malaccensis]